MKTAHCKIVKRAAFVALVLFIPSARPRALGEIVQAGPLVTPLAADNLDPANHRAVGRRRGKANAPARRPAARRLDQRHAARVGRRTLRRIEIPGPRHLRIGFKTPIVVGTVIVRGGGQLSMLRPTAPYPGDLADDSQWAPAECRRTTGQPLI